MKNIAIFVVFVFFVLLLAGCAGPTSEKPDKKEDAPPKPPPTVITPPEQPPVEDNNDSIKTTEGLSKKECEAAFGKWNECGSACRGAPEGTACILICLQHCECGMFNAFSCPVEYTCEDIIPPSAIDGVGICKKIPKEVVKEQETAVTNVTKISINITISQTKDGRNITTKDRDGLLFADRSYIVILDDTYVDETKPKTECALISVISTGGERFGSGKICIGEDYLWNSPGNETFKVRLADISPAESELVKWVDIIILK